MTDFGLGDGIVDDRKRNAALRWHFGAEDLPLFAPAVRGSRTSAQAADSLGPATLNALQRRVLELLQATPEGLTDEEMQTRLGMNPSTQRPRRIELARRRMVVEAGTRRTSSGRMAVVWQISRRATDGR